MIISTHVANEDKLFSYHGVGAWKYLCNLFAFGFIDINLNLLFKHVQINNFFYIFNASFDYYISPLVPLKLLF